jgi:hypothetical protein
LFSGKVNRLITSLQGVEGLMRPTSASDFYIFIFGDKASSARKIGSKMVK